MYFHHVSRDFTNRDFQIQKKQNKLQLGFEMLKAKIVIMSRVFLEFYFASLHCAI